jgi:hypothetical protein
MKTDINQVVEKVSADIQSLLKTLDTAKVHAVKMQANPSNNTAFFKPNRTTPELIEKAVSAIEPIVSSVNNRVHLTPKPQQ